MNLTVEEERIDINLRTLATFSDTKAPAITRIVFSKADLQARTWLKGLLQEEGLTVREDAVGNTFARWIGSDPGLPAVATGSHIDAIPNSGMYDGTVGVLGALEAIRSLRATGYQPRRSIELILFTSEEPTRFGIGCLGSRLLSRQLSPETATLLRDKDGLTLDDLRSAAGMTGELKDVALPPSHYASFVELHIEQGPTLERDRIDLGVVTNIAAPATLRILIEGEGGHAGAVLMHQRRDALCAAAEMVLVVERLAKGTGAVDTVGTTGYCEVFPGAVNSIPSRVKLEVDIRDTELGRRDRVLKQVRAACEQIGIEREVDVRTDVLNADEPAHCDETVVNTLVRTAAQQGVSVTRMISRAYHDTLFMSRIAPSAMLFIPCRNGVSHRPDEFASTSDIAKGTAVLARSLAELAS